MDKKLSSVNQRTEGSSNETNKQMQTNEFNNKATSNYNSFEFLDMSSCDETQKLKLKNTLSASSSSTTYSAHREKYRSNLAMNNSPVLPHKCSTTVQYHPNNNNNNSNSSKIQKTNYQFYTTKQMNSIEHELPQHAPFTTRSFSSEPNNFSGKYNNNFNNSNVS
ncbi:CLUMA_CG017547, isoform A, partial [Clunio marinus]